MLFSQSEVKKVFLCALIGIVYSGFLTYEKLSTGVCSLGTVCPYLFGVPVCVFGFFGFLIILILLGAMTFSKWGQPEKIGSGIFWFSLAGSLFALYYLIREIFFVSGIGWMFLSPNSGFPSCLIGFISFMGISLLTYNIRAK